MSFRPRRSSERATTMLPVVIAVVIAGGCASQGNVFSLDAGDCFDDPESGGEISDLPIADCDEPHDNEVFAVVELAQGDFPGEPETADLAQQACLENFEPFVGQAYEASELFASWLLPTEGSWQDGDREAVCFLFDEDAPLEGSMAGSGR